MLTNFDRSAHPRLVIYSQDGFGLGHMRRTNSIARQFLQAHPQACVLTLSDSPMGQLFETANHQDYLKLPSIVKNGPGNWSAVKLPMPFDEVLALRQHLIRSAVLCFNPHLLLVDHMPHGAMSELTPTLEALKEIKSGAKIILGLRDILDAPGVIRNRWRDEGAYETIEKYYDLVLVYGMREVYDLAEQYHFEPKISQMLHYCGYVCTPATARYAVRARAQSLSNTGPGTKFILVMAGGGADAYPMMRAVFEALPLVLTNQPCVITMITGPFMPAEQRHELEGRSRHLPVRVRNTVSDVLSYLDAADLVISMAGYNSTMEILRSGKPAILIPRTGPSAEQRTRARLFSARGWIQYVDLEEATPDRLGQAILTNLRTRPKQATGVAPNLAGVHAAADRLLSLLPGAPSGVTSVPIAAFPSSKAAL
jgi:predicted glycosyltransferase